MLRTATQEDLHAATELLLQLWHEDDFERLKPVCAQFIASPSSEIVLYLSNGVPAAVAVCSLRTDYVEGTASSPVGYLEGILVPPELRGRGIARALLERCEQWARERGCTEFASDCEIDNTASLHFHLHTGFSEANRIICFSKKL